MSPRRDWAAAIRHLTRLVDTHPNNGELALRLARNYALWAAAADSPAVRELLEQALANYTRAITWVDDYPSIGRTSRAPLLAERSKVLRQLDRPEEAEADLREAQRGAEP